MPTISSLFSIYIQRRLAVPGGQSEMGHTENYYACTNEILSGLGEMYVCDERFQKNIDRACGAGTADFARQAIAVYCGKENV